MNIKQMTLKSLKNLGVKCCKAVLQKSQITKMPGCQNNSLGWRRSSDFDYPGSTARGKKEEKCESK